MSFTWGLFLFIVVALFWMGWMSYVVSPKKETSKGPEIPAKDLTGEKLNLYRTYLTKVKEWEHTPFLGYQCYRQLCRMEETIINDLYVNRLHVIHAKYLMGSIDKIREANTQKILEIEKAVQQRA